jgi:hypothetical protein
MKKTSVPAACSNATRSPMSFSCSSCALLCFRSSDCHPRIFARNSSDSPGAAVLPSSVSSPDVKHALHEVHAQLVHANTSDRIHAFLSLSIRYQCRVPPSRLLDWPWILSKRCIPHIAPLLVDIVCTALCDIADMFRRVSLGTAHI